MYKFACSLPVFIALTACNSFDMNTLDDQTLKRYNSKFDTVNMSQYDTQRYYNQNNLGLSSSELDQMMKMRQPQPK